MAKLWTALFAALLLWTVACRRHKPQQLEVPTHPRNVAWINYAPDGPGFRVRMPFQPAKFVQKIADGKYDEFVAIARTATTQYGVSWAMLPADVGPKMLQPGAEANVLGPPVTTSIVMDDGEHPLTTRTVWAEPYLIRLEAAGDVLENEQAFFTSFTLLPSDERHPTLPLPTALSATALSATALSATALSAGVSAAPPSQSSSTNTPLRTSTGNKLCDEALEIEYKCAEKGGDALKKAIDANASNLRAMRDSPAKEAACQAIRDHIREALKTCP